MTQIVRGEIMFSDPPQLSPHATARVRLLDTSYADAPAVVIAEQVLTDIAAAANQGKALPFELSGTITDERGRYSVSVHISQNGVDRIEHGDYIHKQSYPVLTHGYSNRITVQVAQVH